MNEVFSQWLAMQVLAVTIDVIHGHFLKRVSILAAQFRVSHLKSMNGGFLSAKHNIVNLTLPGGEFSIHRSCASDVTGIHGILSSNIHHHQVSILHVAGSLQLF